MKLIRGVIGTGGPITLRDLPTAPTLPRRGEEAPMPRLPRITRTDVALTCLSAAVELAGVVYFVHRRKWFRV